MYVLPNFSFLSLGFYTALCFEAEVLTLSWVDYIDINSRLNTRFAFSATSAEVWVKLLLLWPVDPFYPF